MSNINNFCYAQGYQSATAFNGAERQQTEIKMNTSKFPIGGNGKKGPFVLQPGERILGPSTIDCAKPGNIMSQMLTERAKTITDDNNSWLNYWTGGTKPAAPILSAAQSSAQRAADHTIAPIPQTPANTLSSALLAQTDG